MPDLKTQLCSVTVFGMTSRLMLVVSCIVLVLFQVQPIYSQVLPVEDARVGEPKTLNTKWAFPHVSSAKAWKARAAAIRLQAKVSCGLYPMPERTPLKPIINGRIEHDKYTVENVSIQTLPGYFLYGNLYRPRLKDNKKVPGILNPHGHWTEGRLVDRKEGSVAARCINFAEQGMVAFAYDMFGYNDTKQAGPHREYATDLASQLWGINLMGLQTWNSIRALDFLETLPEIDRTRLACTGGSGGGTQTFMLGLVDDRLAAQAPCVMVSHSMQGGCLCENAPGLRVQFSNMEVSAAVAPRPQMLVAATGDWTKTTLEIEGPGIRSAYRVLGASAHLDYVLHDFGHNYNQSSRESVYGFFQKWFYTDESKLDVSESDYTKEPDNKLLFLAQAKEPESAVSRDELLEYLKSRTRAELLSIKPMNKKSLKKFQKIMRPAWERSLQIQIGPSKLLIEKLGQTTSGGVMVSRYALGLDGLGNRVPVIQLSSGKDTKNWAVVVHPKGKGSLFDLDGAPVGLAKALLEEGIGVVAPDLFLTGELSNPVFASKRKLSQGYFTVYNRTDLQERLSDLVAVTRYTRNLGDKVILAGVGRAGLWVQSASPLADAIIADCAQFSVDDKSMVASDLFFPGFYRLGGFEGMGLVAGALPKFLHNTGSNFSVRHMADVYESVGLEDILHVTDSIASDDDLARWAGSL